MKVTEDAKLKANAAAFSIDYSCRFDCHRWDMVLTENPDIEFEVLNTQVWKPRTQGISRTFYGITPKGYLREIRIIMTVAPGLEAPEHMLEDVWYFGKDLFLGVSNKHYMEYKILDGEPFFVFKRKKKKYLYPVFKL